jgi:hypothetical protein
LLFTQEMAEPYLIAFQLEGGAVATPPAGVPAEPWCNVARKAVRGLLRRACVAAGLLVMKKRLLFTQEMAEPYLIAFQLEGGAVATPPAGVPAEPWCNVARKAVLGLSSADDGTLETTCFADVEPSKHSIEGSQFSATSVDCKMVDATRIAEQLKVKTNTSLDCSDVNRLAVEVANKLPARRSCGAGHLVLSGSVTVRPRFRQSPVKVSGPFWRPDGAVKSSKRDPSNPDPGRPTSMRPKASCSWAGPDLTDPVLGI